MAGGIYFISMDERTASTPTPTVSSTTRVSVTPTVSKSPTPMPSVTASAKPSASVTPKPTTTATPQPSPTAAPAAQEHTVEIKSFAFAPGTLTVKKGDKVTFINKDSAPHTATSVATAWDSGNLSKDQSFTLNTSLLAPGTYQYFCAVHPSMKATLIIQ